MARKKKHHRKTKHHGGSSAKAKIDSAIKTLHAAKKHC